MIYIKFQLYTLDPLDPALRTAFSLATNAYKDAERALQQVMEYKPVFFRQERHKGLLFQPDGKDYTEEYGFKAYKYMGKLETDNQTFCRISTWGREDIVHSTYGDSASWLLWEKPLTILKMTEGIVEWMD